MKGHNQPRPPRDIHGFKVGDRVKTPIGRVARITALRVDGYVDAEYEGWYSRDGAVILQPQTLTRA